MFGTPATAGTTFGFGQTKPTNTSLNVPSQPQSFSFPQSTTQQQPSTGFGLGKVPTTASTTASNQTTSFPTFGGFGVGSTSASPFNNTTSSFVGFNSGKAQVTTAPPTAPITTATTEFTLGSVWDLELRNLLLQVVLHWVQVNLLRILARKRALDLALMLRQNLVLVVWV